MTAVSNLAASARQRMSTGIIAALSTSHLLNDLMQFLLPALYPLLKDAYGLTYLQIGLLTLAQQITACILQPVFGLYGDLRPKPYWLALSLALVGIGVFLLATANGFGLLFLAAMVLLMFTFVMNTLAEMIRQRLRVKYSSL